MEFGIEPQLARAAAALPVGPQWAYEQKFDGFRAIVFVDGAEHRLQSRGAKDLTRYFPELRFPPGRYVLDGEIVIDGEREGSEAFGALQQRIHPAASRIERLAREWPASYVAFDLLERDGAQLLGEPFERRRAELDELEGLRRSELVRDAAAAERWLRSSEGVVAKRLDAAYAPGKRTAMVKVKRVRTIDCVVIGWRPGKEPDTVGALILGLYDDGALRVVGHCSGLKASEKRRLVEFFAAYETGEGGSGEPSRWSAGRDLEWRGLRPELVVEVEFDHVSAGRIRHGAKLLRWREDKPPGECDYEQLTS